MTEKDLLRTLTALCDDLAWGRSADEQNLFSLTQSSAGPEDLVRLAEAFGLMLIKVEAREIHNMQLLADITQRNRELEEVRAILKSRNNNLMQTVQATYHTNRIIGQCESMRSMLQMALSVARRPINTLLRGQTGTGKEVIAKLIHYHSPRREGPFIAVNCTAIPDTLFESEMFGIEKGVATGVSFRRGLVEEASGGTLFLDEIGDMSLPNQAKLLRVLEEREIMRVGSSKTVSVDINVIAAANKSLEKAVAEGAFRQDLYYRINVTEINIPPLCERGDDILLLAYTFLKHHCTQMGRTPLRLERTTERMLLKYNWPGNVRELSNEMERAAALTAGDLITPLDLSPRIVQALGGMPTSSLPPLAAVVLPEKDAASGHLPADPQRVHGAVGTERSPMPRTGQFNLEETERHLILEALAHTRGNRTQTAQLLGITREGLRKKMLRFNLVEGA